MSTSASKKIKKFRIAKGMTQTALAEMIGISQNTLSEYESGKHIPSDQYIKRLNELGANIHPPFFTVLRQKLTVTFLFRAMSILQQGKLNGELQLSPYFPKTRSREEFGIRIMPQEGLWIAYQLKIKGISQADIAAKLGVKPCTVNNILRGSRHSTRIEDALYQTLGFSSFESMLAAARGKEKAA